MRYPAATWKPLPENATQARINPTQLIIHTAVDAPGDSSLYPYFSRGDVGAESHFFVKLDGTVEQYMDTEVKANANRTADVRAVSVETEDEGDPEGVPWTPAQIESLVRLILWLNEAHGVPVRLCPAHDQPGVGWHSMWGFRDPIAQTGPVDNPWSSFKGKVCPGKTRIRQFLDEVLPEAERRARPAPTVQKDEDSEMSLVWVHDRDEWYLIGPRGAARILSWDAVSFWKDTLGKVPWIMKGSHFDAVCSGYVTASVIR